MAVLLFASCEKENNDSTPDKRIKQILYEYSGGNVEKYIFSYDGENVKSIIIYDKEDDKNWIESCRYDYTYSGDVVTEVYSEKADVWEPNCKTDYNIKNGLREEELYYYIDGAFVKKQKWTYQYIGGSLSAWQFYDYSEGGFEQTGKAEYIYQDGKLSEYRVYELDDAGDWSQYDKETFVYDGDKLTSWVNYDKDSALWVNSHKEDLFYLGDRLYQKNRYYWSEDSEMWKADGAYSYIYNYDDDGDLIGSLSENRKVTCEYEEGLGNALSIWYYPEDMVYGYPTIRSANVTVREYVPYYKRIKNR